MTDYAAINPCGVPNDIWTIIASFLDDDDLANFRQICKATQFVGSHASILQPLYNRLYAMDNTLPALLPQEGALLAFKQAFAKIHARQQEEIAYLTQRHRFRVKVQNVQVFQLPVSLKVLEDRNLRLDEINGEIIKSKINSNETRFYLNGAPITRIPVSLFQEEKYIIFWQNLTHLYCNVNQLTHLNVQGLRALQVLYCQSLTLASLNVQGLTALQHLDCGFSSLISLNVEGLMALQHLDCWHSKITSLDVQGLPALQKLNCAGNQLTHLNTQGLMALEDLQCDNNQLTSLNVQGLKSLKTLLCNRNKLTSLNIQGLVALENLDISDNLFSKLDAQGLRLLRRLGCSGNQLIELNLQGLASLENLSLGEVNLLETLNLTGVSEVIKNKYGALEQRLLIKKLKQAVVRLGTDSALNNSLYYYPGLVKDFVSKAPAVIFSTFSSLNQSIFSKEERQEEENPNNKRKRDEGDEKNKKRAKKS